MGLFAIIDKNTKTLKHLIYTQLRNIYIFSLKNILGLVGTNKKFIQRLFPDLMSFLYEESLKNNTYKNNQIDKDGRAGGLAWLGYRLDMAGIARSNRVRPTLFTLYL